MKNLQLTRQNLFKSSILAYLLPLLPSPQAELVTYDIDLMYGLVSSFTSSSSLIENDHSNRILIAAVNNNIIATIQTKLTDPSLPTSRAVTRSRSCNSSFSSATAVCAPPTRR